jgi:hypothetical protein
MGMIAGPSSQRDELPAREPTWAYAHGRVRTTSIFGAKWPVSGEKSRFEPGPQVSWACPDPILRCPGDIMRVSGS